MRVRHFTYDELLFSFGIPASAHSAEVVRKADKCRNCAGVPFFFCAMISLRETEFEFRPATHKLVQVFFALGGSWYENMLGCRLEVAVERNGLYMVRRPGSSWILGEIPASHCIDAL